MKGRILVRYSLRGLTDRVSYCPVPDHERHKLG